MKLARFVHAGSMSLGLVDAVNETVTAITTPADNAVDAMIALCGQLQSGAQPMTAGRPLPLATVRLLPPIAQPRKNVLCIGKNYLAHAREFATSGFDSSSTGTTDAVPDVPIVFTKAPCTLVGARDDVVEVEISGLGRIANRIV